MSEQPGPPSGSEPSEPWDGAPIGLVVFAEALCEVDTARPRLIELAPRLREASDLPSLIRERDQAMLSWACFTVLPRVLTLAGMPMLAAQLKAEQPTQPAQDWDSFEALEEKTKALVERVRSDARIPVTVGMGVMAERTRQALIEDGVDPSVAASYALPTGFTGGPWQFDEPVVDALVIYALRLVAQCASDFIPSALAHRRENRDPTVRLGWLEAYDLSFPVKVRSGIDSDFAETVRLAAQQTADEGVQLLERLAACDDGASREVA